MTNAIKLFALLILSSTYACASESGEDVTEQFTEIRDAAIQAWEDQGHTVDHAAVAEWRVILVDEAPMFDDGAHVAGSYYKAKEIRIFRGFADWKSNANEDRNIYYIGTHEYTHVLTGKDHDDNFWNTEDHAMELQGLDPWGEPMK